MYIAKQLLRLSGVFEDLENWRRTHYSMEINPSLNLTEVIIMGWLSSIRDHGNIKFYTISDRFGNIQITLKIQESNDSLITKFTSIREHTSIAVKGCVRAEPKAPNGAEIIPSQLKILSLATKPPPFMTQSIKDIGFEVRLDLRALDLRRPFLRSLFDIRYTVLESCREFLKSQYFIEVNTPKIISTATEGGATLFPIFYYNREAFLAQSPQLYKEQLTMAFENVFEIAPIFRAEPSRTNRHLSEAISIDVEKAFVDYTDVMEIMEHMISHILVKIREKNQQQLDYLRIQLPNINLPFPRYRYSDLIDKLQSYDENIEWGDDLSYQKMQNLKDEGMNNFYFVTDWPTAIKPFYVKSRITNPIECESFDLMFRSLEISSGSTRIRDKEQIIERMKKQGLNSEAFDSHLRVFDYGIPPHAGFGIGLERLLMSICNVENIRDVTFYPRDIDRLTP
jgi:nondiscriminating aspartyl-tRNA synthetase